jgi:hypothetical protein
MGLNGAPHPPNLEGGFVRPKRKSRITRGQGAAITSIIAIIVATILLLPAIMPGDHINAVERNASTKEEMDAIMTAEGMDMAGIVGIERFGRSSFGGFRWTYVTDKETIDFYRDIIEERDGRWSGNDASLEYIAECQQVDRVLLYPGDEFWENRIAYETAFTMESSNPNADFESTFRFIDLEGLPGSAGGYILEDAYIIRQHLRLDLILSDEYHNIIEQLVILDADLNLKVLMADPLHREITICR